MSYNADHLAWQQRVSQEQHAAYRFLDQTKSMKNIVDPFNYLIDQEQQIKERNKLMSIYHPPLYTPQSNSTQKGFQFLDTGGKMYNGLLSYTPRNHQVLNKQSYTFGGSTNIMKSPVYENEQSNNNTINQSQLDKNFYQTKQAYVKKQRNTCASSARSSVKGHPLNDNLNKGSVDNKKTKTFYPPNYDKVNGCMEKLPRIQRFNEEYETTSTYSKQQMLIPQQQQQVQKEGEFLNKVQQPQYQNLLQKAKPTSSLLFKNKDQSSLQAPSINQDDKQKEVERYFNENNNLVGGENEDKKIEQDNDIDENEEGKSELIDEINSLYNMENPRGDDLKSVATSKAKSQISKRSQVIINNLEKQLEQERNARKKLEEELESIKQMTEQLLKTQKQKVKN